MTPTLEAMAREAGGSPVDYDDPQCSIGDMAFDPEGLTRFAALVRAQALEDAARLCDARAAEHDESAQLEQDPRFAVYAKHERRCAAAIRAMKPA